VCVCVCFGLELVAKAMTPHPSGSGRNIGYVWAPEAHVSESFGV
jgi:hypothetical protein